MILKFIKISTHHAFRFRFKLLTFVLVRDLERDSSVFAFPTAPDIRLDTFDLSIVSYFGSTVACWA